MLAIVTEGKDAELVAAGWLHDTVEDTGATRADLAGKFGERVASLVVEVTDDMSLPQSERRRRQIEDAPKKSPAAKLIRDRRQVSNIRARIVSNPSQAERDDLADYFGWADKVVAGCKGGNVKLNQMYGETAAEARRVLLIPS